VSPIKGSQLAIILSTYFITSFL